MALAQLLRSKELKKLKEQFEEARLKEAGFLVRKTELEKREKELETLVEEAESPTEEEQSALEEEISVFEENSKALKAEQEENAEQTSKLSEDIKRIESELEEFSSRSKKIEDPQSRKEDGYTIETRFKFFRKQEMEVRNRIIGQEDVKSFIEKVRSVMKDKRSITGGELTIPDVLLGIMRDSLHHYSKLLSKVTLRRVPGTSRTLVAGPVPEAVWTEACASLNELNILFNQVEMDGYKVGGFIAICNALMEDSDLNLVDEIMHSISQGIGLALDKAIAYGTGKKMPLGIVPRLAQVEKPSDWGTDAPAWKDLSTSNILKVDGSLSDKTFYQALIRAAGKARPNYSTGGKFWAMNDTTFAELQAKALGFNANGAIVTGQNSTMPVIGGEIVILPFIPDNNIIGGYGSLYVMAERTGSTLSKSEHVRFIEDQTVFKGTARYDGMPVIAEGFVAVSIDGSAPATAVAFAPDTANAENPEENEG